MTTADDLGIPDFLDRTKKPGLAAPAPATDLVREPKAENPRAVKGNNSDATAFAGKQLLAVVERIERVEEEQKALADDKREIYQEAKSNGFDTKTVRQVVRLRKQDAAERQEQQALLDLYLSAIGLA